MSFFFILKQVSLYSHSFQNQEIKKDVDNFFRCTREYKLQTYSKNLEGSV